MDMFKQVVCNAEIQDDPYILANYNNENGATKEIVRYKIF